MPAKRGAKEPVKGPLLIAGDADTVPVYQKVTEKGKPVFDTDGRKVPEISEYRLTDAPALANYSGPKPESRLVELPKREDLPFDVTDPEWEKIKGYYESGAMDAAAEKGVERTLGYLENPEIAAGKGWYSRMRDKLKQVFGDGAEIVSQLLGATSARTPVDTNYLQAMDAYEQDKAGKFNETRRIYAEVKEALKNDSLPQYLEDAGWKKRLEEQVAKLRSEAKKEKVSAEKTRMLKEAEGYERFLNWESRSREKAAEKRKKAARLKEGKDQKKLLKDADDLEAAADQGLAGMSKAELVELAVAALGILPRQSNGKKFNANSFAVLKVLGGDWVINRNAPKTPNFAGNLSGRTTEATIDVWAARFLRHLLYSDFGPWRIPPSAETGVSTHDFLVGQMIFKAIGKKVGLAPDDLQAVLWFAEKDRWEKAGWTSSIGAGKTSFDTMFNLFFPENGKPRTLSEVKQIVDAQRAERDAAKKQAEKDAAEAAGMSVSAWKKQQAALKKARAKDEIAVKDEEYDEE